MIPDKRQGKTSRIPVDFVDEEVRPALDEGGAIGEIDDSISSTGDDGEVIDEGQTGPEDRIEGGGELENEGDGLEVVEVKDGDSPAVEATDSMDTGSDGSNPNGPYLSGESDAAPQEKQPAAGPMLAELVATRSELRRVETERNDLLERLARRQADFENYRKRVERERSETYHRMVGDMVGKLLPVMDNMRRALKAESLMEKNESAEFRHFLRGVELIYKQLNDALVDLGVEAVPAVGQPFDPHVHEAVATEHSEEYEPDIVTQELLRGYRLGEKLLRPAMVKVSTKQ